MSLFRYEPFYDVDRIFNEFFGEAQRRRGEGASSDVVQTLKPRYVAPSPCVRYRTRRY